MQSIRNLCSQLLDCIHKCFQNEQEEFHERMIELEDRIDRPPYQRQSEENKIEIQTISEKEHHLTTDTVERKPEKLKELPVYQEVNRASQRSDDSFFSINSAARSSQSISRRTFSRIRGRKSSLHSIDGNISKENEYKEITNDNLSEEMNVELIDSEFNCYSDTMIEWNEKEYDKPMSSPFMVKMSDVEMRKIKQNNVVDETMNRLEDFYTFYFNDLNNDFENSGKKTNRKMSFTHGHIFHKSPMFKNAYQSENEDMNVEGGLMMMLIIFQCNSSNSHEFLKWYNSQNILSKLYNFQRIRLIENGSCPILEVDQFGSDLREKQTFQIFRQIETVKFDNEPDVEYTIQLDCSFKKGTRFRSLLRFQNSDNGIVEIYAESNEKLSSSPQDYYLNKWQNFEKSVKEKLSRVHNTNTYR